MIAAILLLGVATVMLTLARNHHTADPCASCEGTGRQRALTETWCAVCGGSGDAVEASKRRHPSGGAM